MALGSDSEGIGVSGDDSKNGVDDPEEEDEECWLKIANTWQASTQQRKKII